MARVYDGSGIGPVWRGENIINAPGPLAELASLDRYGRRAPSRRKFAICARVEACAAVRPFSNEFGPRVNFGRMTAFLRNIFRNTACGVLAERSRFWTRCLGRLFSVLTKRSHSASCASCRPTRMEAVPVLGCEKTGREERPTGRLDARVETNGSHQDLAATRRLAKSRSDRLAVQDVPLVVSGLHSATRRPALVDFVSRK